MVVVLELCEGEEIMPIVLSFAHEDSQVLLQLLVHPFRLAVSLGVVCGGHCDLDPQTFVELLCELPHELRPPVRDDLVREPMEFPHVVQEQTCRSWGCDRGVRGHEVCAFG